MVRKKQPNKGKFRIYQHFAAATVAITLVIALIADGEEGRATAAEALAKERAEAQKSGEIRVVKRAPIFQSMPTSDDGWGSAAGTSTSNAYGSGGVSARGGGGVEIDDATLAKLGLTRAEWNALSDSQKIRLLQQIGRDPEQEEADRQRNAAQMAEESRQRAGGADYGSGGDAPG